MKEKQHFSKLLSGTLEHITFPTKTVQTSSCEANIFTSIYEA